jgi:hypothetical protein
VQQLAARLRNKELAAFFATCGPVKDSQIVKDRVSGRSKGYVLTSIPDLGLLIFYVAVSVMSSSKRRSRFRGRCN